MYRFHKLHWSSSNVFDRALHVSVLGEIRFRTGWAGEGMGLQAACKFAGSNMFQHVPTSWSESCKHEAATVIACQHDSRSQASSNMCWCLELSSSWKHPYYSIGMSTFARICFRRIDQYRKWQGLPVQGRVRMDKAQLVYTQ